MASSTISQSMALAISSGVLSTACSSETHNNYVPFIVIKIQDSNLVKTKVGRSSYNEGSMY